MDMGFDNASRNLASLGIVDFDSNAFIRGTKPAYVGSPEPKVELPFDAPMPVYSSPLYPNYLYSSFGGPVLSSQPSKDAFVSHHSNKGITLKEGLFATLLGGLGILGLAKLVSRKKAPKAPAVAPTVEASAEAATKTAEKATFWSKVKGAGSTAWTKTKDLGSTVLNKFRGAPGWAKASIGVTAGLTVLYGAYKAFSSPKPPHQQEYPQFH